MRTLFRALGFVGACLLTMGGSALGQEGPAAPSYSNVQVVSVDPATRIVVIKNSKGVKETLELDDTLAGASGVKAGDRVMLTVRAEPGRKRISAMTKVTASPAPSSVTASPVAAPLATAADPARIEMRRVFANQVAALSQQARPVDAVWSSFVSSCDVKQAAGTEGAREWFGLWDGRVKADLSSGFCRDLFNQIVGSGEGIKKAMASAEEVARKTLGVEELRDIRRLNSMDWDGWALPAPDKLEP